MQSLKFIMSEKIPLLKFSTSPHFYVSDTCDLEARFNGVQEKAHADFLK